MIIDYEDVAGTYPAIRNAGVTAEDVNSHHIPYAVAEIEGRLASMYTVPFSSNNLTARDLALQLVYSRLAPIGLDERMRVRDSVLERIDSLLMGKETMLTTSGSLASDVSLVWSTTKDYDPVFTMDKPEFWIVDSSQVYAERNERGQL